MSPTQADPILDPSPGRPRGRAASDLELELRFVAQSSRPVGLAVPEIAELDPAARTLLGCEATTAAIAGISGCAGIAVERISQEPAKPPEAVTRWLRPDGADVVRRRVRIGPPGGESLVWAESYVLLDRLPPGFAALADSCLRGIRDALAELATDERRELLWFGVTPAPAWSGTVVEVLTRTYLILDRDRPAIVITEYFSPNLSGTGPAALPASR